jgi:membrane fusion protein (multidrug efflux system)
VPREAVVQQGTSSVVFVNNNGRASQRPIEIGMSDSSSIEVVAGLAPGEQVVVVGQNGLRDGAAIQVVNQAPGQRGGAQGQGQGGGPPAAPGN